MNSNLGILILGLSVSACNYKVAQQPTAPTPRAAPSPGAPISVRWIERSRTETATQLSLEVVKLVQTERPLTVRFTLPAGVSTEPQLVARELDSTFIGTSTTDLLVRTSGQPQQDLVVICDSQGSSFGFHAEVPYRFGRQAPIITEPMVGEPIQVGPGQIRPVQLGK